MFLLFQGLFYLAAAIACTETGKHLERETKKEKAKQR